MALPARPVTQNGMRKRNHVSLARRTAFSLIRIVWERDGH